MRLHDVAADGLAGADGAVVGALRAGEAVAGPAEGPLGGRVQQRVLLLDAKPRLLQAARKQVSCITRVTCMTCDDRMTSLQVCRVC